MSSSTTATINAIENSLNSMAGSSRPNAVKAAKVWNGLIKVLGRPGAPDAAWRLFPQALSTQSLVSIPAGFLTNLAQALATGSSEAEEAWKALESALIAPEIVVALSPTLDVLAAAFAAVVPALVMSKGRAGCVMDFARWTLRVIPGNLSARKLIAAWTKGEMPALMAGLRLLNGDGNGGDAEMIEPPPRGSLMDDFFSAVMLAPEVVAYWKSTRGARDATWSPLDVAKDPVLAGPLSSASTPVALAALPGLPVAAVAFGKALLPSDSPVDGMCLDLWSGLDAVIAKRGAEAESEEEKAAWDAGAAALLSAMASQGWVRHRGQASSEMKGVKAYLLNRVQNGGGHAFVPVAVRVDPTAVAEALPAVWSSLVWAASDDVAFTAANALIKAPNVGSGFQKIRPMLDEALSSASVGAAAAAGGGKKKKSNTQGARVLRWAQSPSAQATLEQVMSKMPSASMPQALEWFVEKLEAIPAEQWDGVTVQVAVALGSGLTRGMAGTLNDELSAARLIRELTKAVARLRDLVLSAMKGSGAAAALILTHALRRTAVCASVMAPDEPNPFQETSGDQEWYLGTVWRGQGSVPELLSVLKRVSPSAAGLSESVLAVALDAVGLAVATQSSAAVSSLGEWLLAPFASSSSGKERDSLLGSALWTELPSALGLVLYVCPALPEGLAKDVWTLVAGHGQGSWLNTSSLWENRSLRAGFAPAAMVGFCSKDDALKRRWAGLVIHHAPPLFLAAACTPELVQVLCTMAGLIERAALARMVQSGARFTPSDHQLKSWARERDGGLSQVNLGIWRAVAEQWVEGGKDRGYKLEELIRDSKSAQGGSILLAAVEAVIGDRTLARARRVFQGLVKRSERAKSLFEGLHEAPVRDWTTDEDGLNGNDGVAAVLTVRALQEELNEKQESQKSELLKLLTGRLATAGEGDESRAVNSKAMVRAVAWAGGSEGVENLVQSASVMGLDVDAVRGLATAVRPSMATVEMGLEDGAGAACTWATAILSGAGGSIAPGAASSLVFAACEGLRDCSPDALRPLFQVLVEALSGSGHVEMSNHMVAVILSSVERAVGRKDLPEAGWLGAYRVAHAALKSRKSETGKVIAIWVSLVRALATVAWERSEETSKLASSVGRLWETLADGGAATKKYVAIVLADVVAFITSGALSGPSRAGARDGMYALLSALGEVEMKWMAASLNESEKAVLQALYEEWRLEGRWSGGV